jgi:hypothetical protein
MVVAAPPPRTPLSPDHALTAASTTSSWSVRTIGNFPKSNRVLMVAAVHRFCLTGKSVNCLSSPNCKNISLRVQPKSVH